MVSREMLLLVNPRSVSPHPNTVKPGRRSLYLRQSEGTYQGLGGDLFVKVSDFPVLVGEDRVGSSTGCKGDVTRASRQAENLD